MVNTSDVEYTISQAIVEKYNGEVIQLYYGETSGSTRYSDFDIEQKLYLEGKVLWGKGMVLALECQIESANGSYKREVLVSCWNIIAVTKKTPGIQITHLFQGNNLK